jgi:hypothetical protein
MYAEGKLPEPERIDSIGPQWKPAAIKLDRYIHGPDTPLVWKYPRTPFGDWWRVSLTYFTLAGITIVIVLLGWRELAQKDPQKSPAADIQFSNDYYEVELGSRGTGYYHYGFPSAEDCVRSEGFVSSTFADGRVTCRFYYSGE